jgi:hypothetical protein
VSSGPNRLDTFIRGADNGLWHKGWDGRAWSGWQPLGGLLTADPAAVSSAGGRIDVFGRGADFALWHRVFDGTTWGGWQSLATASCRVWPLRHRHQGGSTFSPQVRIRA